MVDVIVVGGGVIGALSALELARAGAAVTLLERGEPGREASWAGGGILSPLHPWRVPDALAALACWSQDRWTTLATELHAETGVDPEWTMSGMLVAEQAEHAEALAWAARWGVPMEVLDRAAGHALEPNLGETVPSVLLWLPAVAQVRNPRLMAALGVTLVHAGVTVRPHTEVTALRIAGDRITGVDTAGGSVLGDAVVVAAGAWSVGLMAQIGAVLPIQPVRGQMLLFRAAPGCVRRIVLQGERYVVPRHDGRVLVGSTLEYVGYDKSVTAEARVDLYAAATALIPALAECPIEHHWAGLRPGSPEGVPYIGAHPEYAGLYVNTGHFRNGLVTAPASARLVADMLIGRVPILDPTPYAWRGH